MRSDAARPGPRLALGGTESVVHSLALAFSPSDDWDLGLDTTHVFTLLDAKGLMGDSGWGADPVFNIDQTFDPLG